MPLLICAAVLFITPPPPPSDDGESESPDESPPLLPVLPHQVLVTDDVNVVHRIHCRPFPAVAHPPPQLYANQQEDGPDHPDCQTCNLAGSVGHYRCSPRRRCRQPHPTAEIDISPQCTLPVSATNGHDVFSCEEDYDSWFERDNAAAAAAANALAAPIWNQADWEEHEDAVAAANALASYIERNNAAAFDAAAAAAADALDAPCPRWIGADWDKHDWEESLPLVQQNDRAGSPQSVYSSMPGLETAPPSPPLLRNLLDPLPPHRPEDWQVTVRRDAPDPTLDQMVLWNANILHVPAGGGAARPTYAIQADDVVFCLPAGTGVHVRYHSPFSNGTVELTLHRRPIEERLTLLNQLRIVLLTVGEEEKSLLTGNL
jgi:hypothetical protein